MTYSVPLATKTSEETRIALPEIGIEDFLKASMAPVQNDLKKVEVQLRTSLESKVEGVPEMMTYLIESGGKRIRPLVTCLMARACGHEGSNHISIASVSELLHTATLYHDDVVDDAKIRRGKPTANNLFGNKIIVLAGDLMLAHCFSILMEGGYFDISQALSQTVKEMVEGEILELKLEGNFETTLPQYMSMIQSKTASLFSWSAKAAGMCAGWSKEKCDTLSHFGSQIGLAFQLVDDLMDFLGDEKTMGKSPLQDLEEGKITLPLLLVLKHFPEVKKELKEECFRLWQDPTSHNPGPIFQKIKQYISEPVVLEENLFAIHQTLSSAREALEVLPHSPYRTGLNSLLEYLATRNR